MICIKILNLRFSDLYRNVSRYLKYNECKHDFTGTQKWLDLWIEDQDKIELALETINSHGVSCDCEILSIIKLNVNGGNFLAVLEE